MSKYALMSSGAACATIMAISSAAFAQAQSTPAASANTQATEAVTVTGSRIIQDGTNAPTPVAVVGADQLQNQATPNIAETLNLQPAFVGNLNVQRAAYTAAAATQGLNSLNLRGLGTSRTLVLMDGQRFIPTLTYGSSAAYTVDINAIPQQLVQRVETVTGGASAVYGSDAVGGVVNFILDKQYTGLKIDASGGETTYGDDANEKLDITFGTRFLGDRGHFIFSGSITSNDGIQNSANRGWDARALCVMNNPLWTKTGTNGQPQMITVDNCGENSANGGVINSGPLKGTTFGIGGVPLPFQYGSLVSTPLMSGGQYQVYLNRLTRGVPLDPPLRQQNIFSLLSYNLTDRITATYEFTLSHVSSFQTNTPQIYDGTSGVGVLQANNAFLPASLRAALGGQSFTVSTVLGDLPNITSTTDRYVQRHSLAFDGDFDLFDSNWVWNAYATYGKTRNTIVDYSHNSARFQAAINAVYDSTGKIVCSNGDPACVPFNVFGIGVNSPQAIAYVSDFSKVNQTNTEEVAAVSLTGHPFSLWAGPVGVALDAEYRFDSAHGVSNPQSLTNSLYSGNYKPVIGKDHVVEGALEVEVPLARNFFLAQAADLNLAVRETDYSTSGAVTTWKIGGTWSPIEDVTIRGNVSHDIRAANLGELFADKGGAIQTLPTDLLTNATGFIAKQSTVGNPQLAPESANSQGIGAVWKPDFIPGFSASLDYWSTHMHGEVGSLPAQSVIQLCYDGNQQACGYITRTGPANLQGVGPYAGQTFATISLIQSPYVNIASDNRSGLDEFASYHFPISDILPLNGDLMFTYDGSYYFETYSNSGLANALPTRSSAFWRGNFNVSYDMDDWDFGLTARYTSSQAPSPQSIMCGTSCPQSSTLPSNIVTQNYVLGLGSSVFFDVNVSRRFMVADVDSQFYLNVRNVFDRDPNLSPLTSYVTSYHLASGADTFGRIIRFGLRAELN